MNKNLMIIIHPYIPASVNRVEKWLSQKAKEGWRLSKKDCWSFEFTKCNPYEGKYFICQSFDSSKGLSFDYHMAKKRYAKAKTQLNKSNVSVFEVEIEKIDSHFGDYIYLRNKFYTVHYLKLFVFSLIAFVGSMILFNMNGLALSWMAILVTLLIYSIASLIILYKDNGTQVTACVNPSEK